MLPNWIRLLVEWMCVIAFGLMVFILIQWVTTAFTIGVSGPVQWAQAWDKTVCYWIDSEGCSE